MKEIDLRELKKQFILLDQDKSGHILFSALEEALTKSSFKPDH